MDTHYFAHFGQSLVRTLQGAERAVGHHRALDQVELNETDLDRIAEALSAVKASSIVESVGLELAETEKGRPADVMKCTLHIVLRGEAAE